MIKKKVWLNLHFDNYLTKLPFYAIFRLIPSRIIYFLQYVFAGWYFNYHFMVRSPIFIYFYLNSFTANSTKLMNFKNSSSERCFCFHVFERFQFYPIWYFWQGFPTFINKTLLTFCICVNVCSKAMSFLTGLCSVDICWRLWIAGK